MLIPFLLGMTIGGSILGFGGIAWSTYLVINHINAAEDTSSSVLEGAVFTCDCMTIDLGLLTKEFRGQCIEREDELAAMVGNAERSSEVAAALNLERSEDGTTIVSGELCDPVAHGAAAWPVIWGPSERPAALNKWPNRHCNPVGLGRHCLDIRESI